MALKREVAIKFIKAQRKADEQFAQGFEREAKAYPRGRSLLPVALLPRKYR
jgi:hypothetical protein